MTFLSFFCLNPFSASMIFCLKSNVGSTQQSIQDTLSKEKGHNPNIINEKILKQGEGLKTEALDSVVGAD